MTTKNTNHTKVKHHYCLKIAINLGRAWFVAERHCSPALGFSTQGQIALNGDVAERQFVLVVAAVISPQTVAPRRVVRRRLATIGLKTQGYLKKCLWHSTLCSRVKLWTPAVKLVNGYEMFLAGHFKCPANVLQLLCS